MEVSGSRFLLLLSWKNIKRFSNVKIITSNSDLHCQSDNLSFGGVMGCKDFGDYILSLNLA